MPTFRFYTLERNYPRLLIYRGGARVVLEVAWERHNTWVFRARRVDAAGATCVLARSYWGLPPLETIMFTRGIVTDDPGPERAILEHLEKAGFARHHEETY